jgi:hypothetical protein
MSNLIITKTKFVKVNFYSTTTRVKNNEALTVGYGQKNTILLAVDAIRSVTMHGVNYDIYSDIVAAENSDYRNKKPITSEKLYMVITDIAVGRGINGVSYETLAVDEPSFNRIIAAIYFEA